MTTAQTHRVRNVNEPKCMSQMRAAIAHLPDDKQQELLDMACRVDRISRELDSAFGTLRSILDDMHLQATAVRFNAEASYRELEATYRQLKP